MIYAIMANVVAILHGLFVLFVLAGGQLSRRWPSAVWLHLPIALYGIAIMVFSWTCPLTTLEIAWRQRAGQTVDWTEFLQHYLFRHVGLTGSEWFVMVVFIGALLVLNTGPYRQILMKPK